MRFCLLSQKFLQTPRESIKIVMKKVKSTQLIENESIKDSVKEGKIQKNKLKKSKKLKEVISKTDMEELAPKIGVTATNKKFKKNQKNKDSKIEENVQDDQNTNKKQQKVVNEIEQQQDQKKSKKLKVKKEKSVQKPANEIVKELTEVDLKKIAKKKAKKLAQSIKKQERIKSKQQEPKASQAIPNNAAKAKKKDNTKPKENKAEQKPKTLTDPTSSKVLSKKEKKANKRQLIKEQKLEDKQTRDPAVDAATIFIGNIPVNTKRVQLIRLLKDYGPINSIRIRSAGGNVLHKHKQRRDAGSLNAYIVLNSKATAEKSLSLNGTEFKGQHLRVTLSAKAPQTHRKEEAKRTVFVGNLKYTATEETLREIFTSCGEIEYVRCIRDGDKGCKGVAYVCFKTADAVGLALELNQTILDDRPINVERYSINKLGAKDARDAQAEKDSKSKKGAKQRIDGKKVNKNKAGNNSNSKNNGDDNKMPKKNEFKGVKVDALKKKQKLKKKKSNNQMVKLAQKIAPKPKTE